MSAIVSAPTNIDEGLNTITITAAVTLSGNYGGASSHGDTLDLSQLGVPSQSVPLWVDIFEYPPAGTAPNGYIFGYAKGTTMANGRLTLMNNLSEFTQGNAYSAGLLGATPGITLVACFAKFI